MLAAVYFGLLTCTGLQAQSALSLESNGLLECEFVRHSIEYFNAGQGGKDILWDFPINHLSDQEYVDSIVIEADTTGGYRMTDSTHARFFVEKQDSTQNPITFLYQCGEESPLSKTVYSIPLTCMVFPFEYADSITKPFMGNGIYSGDHHFLERGVATIKADATGSLVIDEGDTLRNVLRVYCLKSYSICMDMTETALDTAQIRQIIEEQYTWYARGYRYPVLETMTSTSYHNLNALGTTRKAWCSLPSEQTILNDSLNRGLQRTDSIAYSTAGKTDKDIIRYTLTVNNGMVTLDYDLDADAHIVTLLANYYGMAYRHEDWVQESGNGYVRQVDCSGLTKGTYIFYINVNGKIYSEKVFL